VNKRRGRDKQRQPVPQSSAPTTESVRQIVRREISMSATFSGPLPPPEILIQYNDALPNGAERIIVLAERQAEHRMTLERQVIEADIKRANSGLVAGFIVALAGLSAAVFLVHGGNAAAGTILGGLDLVSLVAVFVYGTVSRRNERQQRARMMSGQS